MKVKSVLIELEDPTWVELYAEGGINCGYRKSECEHVIRNDIPQPQLVAIGLLAIQLIANTTSKLTY